MAVALQLESVKEAGLIYVSDSVPGITRQKSGKGFCYHTPEHRLIRDRATLQRIKKLAIPPAYTDVWICSLEEGHIQATGRDARGRKQYRYHEEWVKLADQGKFSRMLSFGHALPKIRETIDEDLAKHGLPLRKVLATVVWFLDHCMIRVGNEEYAKQNRSYGLTTLKTRHCNVEGSVVQFRFVGKGGIKHTVELANRRMARVVKRIQELPGQELFQYRDGEGAHKSIASADVNHYLKEISGEEFTAKDFRTWGGTVAALEELSDLCGLTGREAARAVSKAMKAVSAHLRNTPAVCRKSYVHPGLVNAFLNGSLGSFLDKQCAKLTECPEWYVPAEMMTLAFLENLEV